jgi:ribonuclease P protein component
VHRKNRLTDREDFKKVYRQGQSTANYQFALYYMERADQGPFRVGVSVSKKIGKAVVRNRLRRRIKEAVRLNQHLLKDGYDLIIIARRASLNLNDFKALQKSLLHVLRKASLLR